MKKKVLAVAMAALLGAATMGTTVMAAASGDITSAASDVYKRQVQEAHLLNYLELKKKMQMEIK